ncbi:MAG: hypothetical protein NVSMB31_13470 [Vulcanimicrobiaceae bacterium]
MKQNFSRTIALIPAMTRVRVVVIPSLAGTGGNGGGAGPCWSVT